MLKDQLKVELKRWEHSFIKKHGRDPKKEDIKKLPEIRDMYRKYARLRKNHSAEISNTTQEQHSAVKLDEPLNTTVIELGPTPQIHGKAMSIFDMNLSPIKSSQAEMAEVAEQSLLQSLEVKDSSKPSVAEELPLVRRQLTFTLSAPQSSPIKREINPKHKAYGPNSPLKLDKENLQISIKTVSPLKRTPIKNTSHETTSFSPSPLLKRPLTRSLLELMKEHEAIVEEFKQIDDEKDDDDTLLSSKAPDNIFAQEDEMVLEVARKTIKTRRRRILRRKATGEDDGKIEKTIADEIMKLKQQRVNEFMGLGDTPNEDRPGPVTNADEEKGTVNQGTQKEVKKRKKKYNLVSNNFKRLKLPTKKSGNRRWNNRRR